jgi:hypothetical protein
MNRFLLALTASLLATGCAPTSFRGSANTPSGPATCSARCSAWGMELVGMVSMGDNYTDGCICGVPGAKVSALDGASAIAGGVVGVETQRRAAQQQSGGR